MADEKDNTTGFPFRIRAGMAQAFEACMLSQVICAFLSFFMSTRSQTASVVLSAVACALAIPIVGIIAIGIVRGKEGRHEGDLGITESVVESVIALVISILCVLAFFPRWGRFSETNPYSNEEKLQCIVEFVVGEKFVVPGSIQSDGLIMKVPEGEEITPPTVFPKPGLTFIGWRYAGTGDPDIAVGTPIYLDANGTKNNSVILYAEYVDEEGTAYCACGSVGDRIFDGASWQGMNTRSFLVTFAPLAVASIVGLVLVVSKKRKASGASLATSHSDKRRPAEETREGVGATESEVTSTEIQTGDDGDDGQETIVTDDEDNGVAPEEHDDTSEQALVPSSHGEE